MKAPPDQSGDKNPPVERSEAARASVERAYRGLRENEVRELAGQWAHAAAQALIEDELSSLTFGLCGALGAGKTTFAQGFVAALPGGAHLYVTSPTYAIMQVYGTRPPVRHVDLYRLDTLEALEAIGYGEAIEVPGINLVEWIRQVPEAIPVEWLEIALAAGPMDVRDIRVRAHGDRAISLLQKVSIE